MRLFAAVCLFAGLTGTAFGTASADAWFPTVLEPKADAVYVEPVVITPRGQVSGSDTNQTKQVVAEAEFWFQPDGGKSVKLDSKAWTAKAGETSGFNFGPSPQLPAGKGWVGIRVLDAEGGVIDFTIHNFTVNKALVPPFPIPPLPVNP